MGCGLFVGNTWALILPRLQGLSREQHNFVRIVLLVVNEV